MSNDTTLTNAVVELMYYDMTTSQTAKRKAILALLALEKELKKLTDIQIHLYLADNQRHINLINGMLAHSKVPEFVSFKDRVLKNHLQVGPLDVPAIFAEFVKGITYFANEEEIRTRPIYHRLYSCGERGDSMYTALHTCYDAQPPEKRRVAEQRIYKCYIERLIFDDVYKHNTMFFPIRGSEQHSQNKQHQDRLEITHKDFKSCFPHIELKIHIEYRRHIPYILTIIKKVSGKIRFTEVYMKDTDDPNAPVKCIITKSSGVFVRFNTFQNIGRAEKVSSKDDSIFTTLPRAYNSLSSQSNVY
jgi:hypothetical protein